VHISGQDICSKYLTEDKQKQKHNTENKNENVMKISDFI
jgi:hypothetical protein